MQQESLAGKPEQQQVRKLPGNPKPRPEALGTGQSIRPETSTEGLMSSANSAVAEYTKASGVRHPLGRGIPADHEALN